MSAWTGGLIYYLSHSLSSCRLPLAYPPLAGLVWVPYDVYYDIKHQVCKYQMHPKCRVLQKSGGKNML
nr:MAG TPA: hypothetical protein [Caudoviricetes sp.]